jgi:hypothetical protein
MFRQYSKLLKLEKLFQVVWQERRLEYQTSLKGRLARNLTADCGNLKWLKS